MNRTCANCGSVIYGHKIWLDDRGPLCPKCAVSQIEHDALAHANEEER